VIIRPEEKVAMPNGHAEEREQVYRMSRFWGVIWDIGDASYYLCLVAMSGIVPISLIGISVYYFESWQGLLRDIGIGVFFILVGFPLGIGICAWFKGWARRRTGVEEK